MSQAEILDAEPLPWIIFDCETTGLPLRGKMPDGNPWPADHPGQPRMASLAMIWTTPTLAITKEKRWFIKPDGWKMEPGATAVNGLTDEFLHDNGVPVTEALDAYEQAIKDGHIFAAYNVVFDAKILRGELRRVGRSDYREQTPTLCIMKKSTGVVKATKANGQIKNPKLSEAMAHFKIQQTDAHTAMGDARSALAILRMLMQIGIDLAPDIVRAKMAAE
jgi:DNA polymerase III epsilon subunit-like protein